MTEYSRTEKYRQLRNKLQQDHSAADSLSTPELMGFSERLVGIDNKNFEPMEEVSVAQNAAHAKVETPSEEIYEKMRKEQEKQPVFDFSAYSRNENDSSLSDNDYVNEYIREVKEYNIEQGNAVSQNTSMNILSQINEINSQAAATESRTAPSRPYQREKKARNDTADIPFRSPFTSDDENTEKIIVDTPDTAPVIEKTRTREDIMAEVQSLVSGTAVSEKTQSSTRDELYSAIQDDRTTRQQLLSQTTHIQAQLDGYEDNLSEVNDKMRYTNRILNMVLVVLIVALAVMLCVLIYWVVLSRGA
ncbi:MAG: hypothetical protein IJM63_03420 [Solobacterium sp.]|nr:hypothetical protein [Solobacterium sp.]MBQ9823522.1 hypothetical protein [Solobacterium sp.]